MTAIEEQLNRLESKIDALTAAREQDASPWLRGDQSAAIYAGFKCRQTFVKWAKARRIKADITDGINFWSKSAIANARGE